MYNMELTSQDVESISDFIDGVDGEISVTIGEKVFNSDDIEDIEEKIRKAEREGEGEFRYKGKIFSLPYARHILRILRCNT